MSVSSAGKMGPARRTRQGRRDGNELSNHDEDELCLTIEGEYRVCLDGEWTAVGPGVVVYLKSADVFAIPGPPDFARLSALAAEHGYSFEERGAPTVAP